MEALVLIFGEMIFALLAPLVALVLDLIGALLASVFSFIPSRRSEPRASSGAAKKVLVLLLVVAAILVGALSVINKFYFADSVRMVFGLLERRSGIEAECSQIDGNVFSGEITLGNCAIVRTDHPGSEFALQLDHVEFDLKLSSLLGTAVVQTAHIAGLRGSVARHQPRDEAKGDKTAEKPRRSFVIQDLVVEDVQLSLSGLNKDGGRFELPLCDRDLPCSISSSDPTRPERSPELNSRFERPAIPAVAKPRGARLVFRSRVSVQWRAARCPGSEMAL